jgi:DNA-binding SARP family transcriptional activator
MANALATRQAHHVVTVELGQLVNSSAMLPRLQLIGEFALEQDSQLIELPQSARRLVAFLAVHDYPLTRSYAAGTLWPDVTQERAAGNLRTSLWRLRQAGADVVTATATTVSLSAGIAVDLHELLRDARVCMTEQEMPDLAERLGGDLLPDWYEEWLVGVRERLRQLRLHALDALCDRLIRTGSADRAIDLALTAVAIEPLRESAHRQLIKAHLAEGNAGEALRQYRAFAALSRQELGIAPSSAMAELIRPVLAGSVSARRYRPQHLGED